jgi:hypothetical protein
MILPIMLIVFISSLKNMSWCGRLKNGRGRVISNMCAKGIMMWNGGIASQWELIVGNENVGD